jgi:cell division protein FtsQ
MADSCNQPGDAQLNLLRRNVQAKIKQPFRPGLGWMKPALAMLTVAGSAAGLSLMLEWMQDPSRWPVRQVAIEGDFRHLLRTELQQAIEPVAAAGFFAMNVSEIQQRLQMLPWVDLVSVRRVWPDRLEVEVREQRAVASWGEHAFMNAQAQVFEPADTVELPQLPRLDGPAGHEQNVLGMYRDMQSLVAPLQLGVTQLQLDARRAWHMRLSNGLQLQIGRSQPAQRVARFVRVYPVILAAASGRPVSVDLRYGHGFAVHWQRSDNTARGAG